MQLRDSQYLPFFARQSLVTLARAHAPDVVGVDVFAEGKEDGVADAVGGTVGDRKGRRLGRDQPLHKRNLRIEDCALHARVT